ncbi:MAG TPA: AMP-binding protein, partial [Burkholderiales bacterium]|nr:AMP-binding protein [Burkholderiales bacterium]
MNPQTLTELLIRRVAAGGVAIIDRDRFIYPTALELESRRVTQGLRDLGVREGDRVALWLPNVPAWFTCFFACARLGAIVVAVNTRFRSSEVADIIGRSGAKVLVYWPGYRGIDFEGILNDAGADALSGLTAMVAYDEENTLPDPRENAAAPAPRRALGHKVKAYRDLASCPPYARDHARADLGCLIFTTSGTTKLPKFVLHSQASVASHAVEAARGFGFDTPAARGLLTVPMCGTFGMSNALMPLAVGRSLVMIPTFDAQEAARAIRTHQVTHFPASGDIVAQLLDASKEPIPYPSVRMVLGVRAGQAAPAQARGLTLVGLYGSSEMQAVLSRQPLYARPAQREIGGGKLVNATTEVRARDTASGRILPHGEHGELEFRGSSCMMGYYGNPEATAAAFTDDGFFRSGDLGYTVAEGEYVFLSRIGDVLRLAGFLVNPMEIEAVLDAHPAVGQSQVVGIDGPRGPVPVAFVVPKNGVGVDEATLIAHCKQQIANYKVPHHVLRIDAFPFTASANGNKI